MSTLVHNSEYVRQEANYKQEVTSEIVFNGVVECLEAAADDQPITLGQAKRLIQEAIDALNANP
ncbi:hypothetical protein [Helicobacter rodentium]|uniref:hypothetical protein n=1 Tax=Helicobacter rodentium TaxID=59617 RepID=UPI0025A4CD74|nr:hypothetical protein [Helicobacter rodentium]